MFKTPAIEHSIEHSEGCCVSKETAHFPSHSSAIIFSPKVKGNFPVRPSLAVAWAPSPSLPSICASTVCICRLKQNREENRGKINLSAFRVGSGIAREVGPQLHDLGPSRSPSPQVPLLSEGSPSISQPCVRIPPPPLGSSIPLRPSRPPAPRVLKVLQPHYLLLYTRAPSSGLRYRPFPPTLQAPRVFFYSW